MELAKGIHQLKIPIPDNPLGHLNCYLIEGTEGWFMIDTGWFTPGAFDSLQGQLGQLGLKLENIDSIIVTHTHPDHFGLAGRIKHISPHTKLLMHQLEADLIEPRYIRFSEVRNRLGKMLDMHGVPKVDIKEMESSSMPTLEFVRITFPDQKLFGGERLHTGLYELEIIWTPGHAIGHICVYEPENQFLFSGDHILPTISPNISCHIQSGDNPLGDYVQNLRKLENLAVEKILPAHEDIFIDLQQRIKDILLHHEERKAEIMEAIASQPLQAYDISSRITWKAHDAQWERFTSFHKRVAVTETIAHLECLRWEGQVRRIVKEDKVAYATAE